METQPHYLLLHPLHYVSTLPIRNGNSKNSRGFITPLYSVSTLPIRNGNVSVLIYPSGSVTVSTLPIRNGNAQAWFPLESLAWLARKYLTYKEWKHTIDTLNDYTSKSIRYNTVSTLPIRNGNIHPFRKYSMFPRYVSTLPIRNGNFSPISEYDILEKLA